MPKKLWQWHNRSTELGIYWLWEPRDIWLGVYWNVAKQPHENGGILWRQRQVYVCLLPMLPVLFQWVTREVSQGAFAVTQVKEWLSKE